jgi:hypothetical protein
MSRRAVRSPIIWVLLGCIGLTTLALAEPPAAWTDDLSPLATADWNGDRARPISEGFIPPPSRNGSGTTTQTRC